jgi:hypothetical protein
LSDFLVRREILPPAQRLLWKSLSASIDTGFVLYGGTAAALRLGHRISLDFDFFSERPLDRPRLNEGFPFLNRSILIQDAKDSLTVLAPTASGSVKVSFFGQISIGRTGTPDRTQDGVLEVASLLDLLATKLKVIQQRVEAKDYRDIAAILKNGTGLSDGLGAAAAMYGPNFQPSEALKALSCFEGGDLATLSVDEKKYLSLAVSKVRHITPYGIASFTLSAGD